jgi:hypothetical protein
VVAHVLDGRWSSVGGDSRDVELGSGCVDLGHVGVGGVFRGEGGWLRHSRLGQSGQTVVGSDKAGRRRSELGGNNMGKGLVSACHINCSRWSSSMSPKEPYSTGKEG